MSDRGSHADRHAAMLGELAELGLSLARDLQRRALAAETPEEAAGLADAFHRISRSVRQSLALEAKLARDARQDLQQERITAERDHRAAVGRRQSVLEETLERIVWAECEADEAERLTDRLALVIEDEMMKDGFASGPVEAQLRRLCKALGLSDELVAKLPLARICRDVEDDLDGAARLAEAYGPPPARADGPTSGPAWRSSA